MQRSNYPFRAKKPLAPTKVGAPYYLPRFATEKVVTVNTTAAGGNASLRSLGD